jgi:hypothetical protein
MSAGRSACSTTPSPAPTGGSRNLRHLGQPELTAAVAGAGKRSIGDASAWDRRNAAVDITPLVAATNALWGYATRQQQQSSFNTGVFVP